MEISYINNYYLKSSIKKSGNIFSSFLFIFLREDYSTGNVGVPVNQTSTSKADEIAPNFSIINLLSTKTWSVFFDQLA